MIFLLVLVDVAGIVHLIPDIRVFPMSPEDVFAPYCQTPCATSMWGTFLNIIPNLLKIMLYTRKQKNSSYNLRN